MIFYHIFSVQSIYSICPTLYRVHCTVYQVPDPNFINITDLKKCCCFKTFAK